MHAAASGRCSVYVEIGSTSLCTHHRLCMRAMREQWEGGGGVMGKEEENVASGSSWILWSVCRHWAGIAAEPALLIACLPC